MRIAILSDIHANVTALKAVLDDMQNTGRVEAAVLLGDLVNYGPRPDETLAMVKGMGVPVLANLWGNHEYALFQGGLERFSTERGRQALLYTRTLLSDASRLYLEEEMEHSAMKACVIGGLSFLFVHGSANHPYWGRMGLEEMTEKQYAQYDYVISGHTHVPHYVEQFFAADNAGLRGKKKTVFINPGSVGQPRNQNPCAQYGVLDTESGQYEHRCIRYDITGEQACFPACVDPFYKERLQIGI